MSSYEGCDSGYLKTVIYENKKNGVGSAGKNKAAEKSGKMKTSLMKTSLMKTSSKKRPEKAAGLRPAMQKRDCFNSMSSYSDPMQRIYRYYPEDFGKLKVKVIHMNLDFDIYDTETRVRSKLYLQNLNEPLSELSLNARNLDINLVRCQKYPLRHTYRKEEAMLDLVFNEPVPAGALFTIETDTVCHPTNNVLEGLYYDETPAGAPPQQITQCQQWGFQRLVPCIDDMAAKCTYRTTIRADSRYTNIITNGDVVVERHSYVDPLGNDTGRDEIVYENMKTPMATYLFFLGVGTYATFRKEFEYPDGSCFDLELLVPPGSDPEQAERALTILHDAVMWVYLFTGPEKYKDLEKKKQIFELTKLRDHLKYNLNSAAVDPENLGRTMKSLDAIRGKITELSRNMVPGYKYTGTVYREIGMQNSDFGGMENVGNTTITTNRIMPFKNITDPAFEYMAAVKVHEYYHNLNGSEVTGQSPFEIWLNEAVTVCIERGFMAYFFGDEYERLSEVIDLLAPVSGTFALDRGVASMPILPEGFNDPNDLITSVTYVKAPEFVRMIENLIGNDNFARALDLYHRKYAHGNATTQNWIHEMESASGMDLSQMARTWLNLTGYPVLSVRKDYNEETRVLKLTLTQASSDGRPFAETNTTAAGSGSKMHNAPAVSREDQAGCQTAPSPWMFPFSFAVCDRKGKILYEDNICIRQEKTEVVIPGIDRPAFLSLSRGCSFYGVVDYPADRKELYLQVRRDPDLICRFGAFCRITDIEKERLLKDPEASVSPEYVNLYHEILCDHDLMVRAGGLFLTVFESVDNEMYACRYKELNDARRKIYKAVAKTNKSSLLIIYDEYDDLIDPETEGRYAVRRSLMLEGDRIRQRQVRNNALRLLATLDTPDIHEIIRKQFKTAVHASDRQAAFIALLNSTMPDKEQLIRQYMDVCRKDPVSWESFLAAVAGCDSPDCPAMVRMIESDPAFRIEQSNDQRALYGAFARNRKFSLQTPGGLEFMTATIIKLSAINEYSTMGLLNAFSNIDQLDKAYRADAVGVLVDVLDNISPEKSPSVLHRIRKILLGSPLSVGEFEQESGRKIRKLYAPEA